MRLDRTAMLLFFLAMTLSASGIASDEKKTATATAVEPPKAPQAQPKRRATEPSASFTPSEKIKADSSVSFPVDI